MISLAELQEAASEWGLPITTVERDYVLGWMLWAIGSQEGIKGTPAKLHFYCNFKFLAANCSELVDVSNLIRLPRSSQFSLKNLKFRYESEFCGSS